MRAVIPGALVGALVLAGCMSPAAEQPSLPAPTPADPVPLAGALNEAGLGIFRAAAEDESLALSPVSIGIAFGMVDAGASGPVDAALQDLFGYPAEGVDLLNAFRSLDLEVSSEAGDGAEDATGETVDLPVVRMANAVWFDQASTPEPAYVDTVSRWFEAPVATRDLRGDPEGSREEIDGWVEDRTEGLIPRIMPEDLPNPDTVAILANAVCLKAQWWSPFEEARTSDADFTRLDGSTVTAALMRQGLQARYAQTADHDAVVLPYVGDLEMVVIVPHEGRFAAVRDGLDVASIADLDASLADGHVAVGLPRFTTEATVDLKQVIAERMGVEGLFATVGLDGIGENLVIDAAVHAASVIVDEAGTEAAAATVIGIALTSAPLYDAEVVADRPFLYLVRDTTTGAILFVGQQLDPTAS